MGTEQKQPNRVRAERIKDISHNNPSDGLNHLHELSDLILDSDEGVRYMATDALIGISTKHQLELRKIVPTLISRLDDKSVNVRTNALTVLFNVAPWYPQDFATGSDLIIKSAQAERLEERRVAAGLLAKLATLRPDLVTPREEALKTLKEIDIDELTKDTNEPFISEGVNNDAIKALRGGDMASRPLNEDLAPVPRSTKLSKPANVAFHALYVGICLPLVYGIALINALRFSFRYRHYGAAWRTKMLYMDMKKVKFLKNWNRAVLFLRSSMWLTPAQFVPFLPGKRPIREDHTVRTPDYPEKWGIIARTVYERDGWACNNCGCGGGPKGDNELHADHQEPRSKGGSDHPNNLRVLCKECHEARHSRIF